jgi:hypothetical protein
MKHKVIGIGLLFFSILTISSCKKTLEIKLPDEQKKIVINSLFTENDTMIVNISKSLHILDNLDVKYLSDAEVFIYEDNILLGQLTHSNNGDYYSSELIPNINKQYRVEVFYPDLEMASASSIIPQKVPILSIDTATVYSNNQMWGSTEPYPVYELTINFKDPIEVTNYYILELKYLYEYEYEGFYNSNWYDLYYYSEDILLSDNVSGVFSDELINGKNYNLKVTVDKYNFYTDTTLVQANLISITEDYYLYKKTLDKHNEAKGNPFAEPVQVYNNIKNGYGIFSGYQNYAFHFIVKGSNYYYEDYKSNQNSKTKPSYAGKTFSGSFNNKSL